MTRHSGPAAVGDVDGIDDRQRCGSRFSVGGGTAVRCLDPDGHPPPHEYAPDDGTWVITWADTATSTGERAGSEIDGAAQEVCRGIELHLSHNGALPWPSIRRPYEHWLELAASGAAGGHDVAASAPGPAPTIEDVEAVGGEIQSRRVERGWSTFDLAAAAGCSESMVRAVETGSRQASLRLLSNIATALHIRVTDLLGEATR